MEQMFVTEKLQMDCDRKSTNGREQKNVNG